MTIIKFIIQMFVVLIVSLFFMFGIGSIFLNLFENIAEDTEEDEE